MLIVTKGGVPAPPTNAERAAKWRQKFNAVKPVAGGAPPCLPSAPAWPHHDYTPNPRGAKRLRPEALDERKAKPEQSKAPPKGGKGIQQ